MKLLYLEARKGILRRYIFIVFVLFLCLNTVKIDMDYHAGDIRPVAGNVSSMQTGYSQIYDQVRGTITEETAGFVAVNYQRLNELISDGTYSRERQTDTYSGYLYGDFYLFHKYFYPSMEYSVHYRSYAESILKQAAENQIQYQALDNTADAAKSTYILAHYADRNIRSFYIYDGWDSLLSYDFSDFLILLLLILTIAPIFTREKETGMTLILHSCRRGRWHLLLSKCGVSVLFVCITTLLFSLANFITFGILCGFAGGASPLYAIESYKNTPYSGSIFSFYILCTVLKAFGFSVISLVLTLLSACFRKTLYPCLIGFGIGLIFCFLAGWSVSPIWWQEILALSSPLTLTKGSELFANLYGAGIGGFYLLRINVLLIVQFIITRLLVYIIGRKSCYRLN